MKIRYLWLAGMLAVTPVTFAVAQSTAGSGTTTTTHGPAAMNKTPGSTGKTVVPGTKSTIAGDRPATAMKATGATSGGK